jgi:hypothetical protein
MVNQNQMPSQLTADNSNWLADLDRRFRRLRRAMLLASAIAACLAIVAIFEAVLLSWK